MQARILDFLSKRNPDAPPPVVQLDTNLFDSGILDSFGLVELVALLEAETGLTVSDDDLNDARFTSVAGIMAILAEKTGGSKPRAGDAK